MEWSPQRCAPLHGISSSSRRCFALIGAASPSQHMAALHCAKAGPLLGNSGCGPLPACVVQPAPLRAACGWLLAGR